MILELHAHRQGQEVGEALPECGIASDLAADVADHPPETGLEELQLAPRPHELVGMSIAADHDRRPLGHPNIALPQPHIVAPGEIDQLLQRPVDKPRVGCATALGCTVVSTTTRSKSRVASAPVLCATDRLS